ncbi:MAG: class I SAM-dependent rRNA methyltransferase [Gammaproteobacteria bacterium]
MKQVILAPGREKSLRRRHPWVFSGAVQRVSGAPQRGDSVRVLGSTGEFLGYGVYCPKSQIRVRVLSFDESVALDDDLIARRIGAALAYRARALPADLVALRLVHGEADGLPGLIVDRYGEVLVVQCQSAAAERWRDAAVAALEPARWRAIVERSDAEVRGLEGLAPRSGILHGSLPDAPLLIDERGVRYRVDVLHGQKTGFFLDQRDNRALVGAVAAGCEVLDVFCYSGGFALAALSAGAAHVTAIDSSTDALAQARANAGANGCDDAARVEWRAEDAFAALRALHAAGRRFDVVTLDPPKFAPTGRHVQRAARAYKDVNLWALRLLRPGGRLFTFSCSGAVDEALFQSIVAGAAVDARVDGRVLARLGAAADHPLALNFPEGAYLKGLLVMVE